jgi:hypothetical protein
MLDLLLLIVHDTCGVSRAAEWVLMELLMLEGEPPLTIPRWLLLVIPLPESLQSQQLLTSYILLAIEIHILW